MADDYISRDQRDLVSETLAELPVLDINALKDVYKDKIRQLETLDPERTPDPLLRK